VSFGQKRELEGSLIVKEIVVLMFGLGPVSPGFVVTSFTAFACSGGRRLFKLNLMNGFFIGSSPKD